MHTAIANETSSMCPTGLAPDAPDRNTSANTPRPAGSGSSDTSPRAITSDA